MNASSLVLTIKFARFSGICCHKTTFGKSKIRPLKNIEDTYLFEIVSNLGSVVSIFYLLSRKQGQLLIGYVHEFIELLTVTVPCENNSINNS